MSECFILLGSNIGDRMDHISVATAHLMSELGELSISSSIYETAPWGDSEQGAFLNQVLKFQTHHTAENTLSICLGIEKKMGRVRVKKWGERLIDIDILYFNDLILDTAELTIPHPEIQNRRFVLVPLIELNSEYMHPGLKKTNQELLTQCSDSLEVKIYKQKTAYSFNNFTN